MTVLLAVLIIAVALFVFFLALGHAATSQSEDIASRNRRFGFKSSRSG